MRQTGWPNKTGPELRLRFILVLLAMGGLHAEVTAQSSGASSAGPDAAAPAGSPEWHLRLPDRSLTPEEFLAVYRQGSVFARAGYAVHAARGDTAVPSTATERALLDLPSAQATPQIASSIRAEPLLALQAADPTPPPPRSGAAWSFDLRRVFLGAGLRPERLRLDVQGMAPEGSEILLYVYQDGYLLRFIRIRGGTERATEEIALLRPSRSPAGWLRVFARVRSRDGGTLPAGSAPPVAILPSSRVFFDPVPHIPGTFSALQSIPPDSFVLYLPEAVLDHAERALPLLLSLERVLPRGTPITRLRVYTEAEIIRPSTPFVVLGRASMEDLDAPLRLEDGRIRVQPPGAEKAILDLKEQGDWGALQVVSAGGHPGLWLVPSTGYDPLPPDLGGLDEHNAAILIGGDEAFAFSTLRGSTVRVRYPDRVTWVMRFGNYRWAAFILGLVFITAMIAYLLFQTRLHDRKFTHVS